MASGSEILGWSGPGFRGLGFRGFGFRVLKGLGFRSFGFRGFWGLEFEFRVHGVAFPFSRGVRGWLLFFQIHRWFSNYNSSPAPPLAGVGVEVEGLGIQGYGMKRFAVGATRFFQP